MMTRNWIHEAPHLSRQAQKVLDRLNQSRIGKREVVIKRERNAIYIRYE